VFLGIAHDITQVRNLEEQLSNSRKMEAIGRMAGGVAHDFNNLLTVIGGHTSLMRSRRDFSGLDAIEHAVSAAADLTRQLLTVGGQTKLKPEPLNVNVIARDTLEFLAYSLGETIELRFSPEPDLWPASVDPSALERVLINLVVNARDAMPHGGVLTVGTRNSQGALPSAAATSPRARHVLLLVEDTGIGMDASTRARIFEPFFTTKPPGKGTGLGLSAVYGLVTQSGGHIDVTSAPGKGTRFEVRFQPAG
jgi:signal transduction histidine kinase